VSDLLVDYLWVLGMFHAVVLIVLLIASRE